MELLNYYEENSYDLTFVMEYEKVEAIETMDDIIYEFISESRIINEAGVN